MRTTLAIPERETSIQAWQMMQEQCKILVKTGFLPKAVDSPEKAMAIALQSREIGVPMMAGFRLISIIQGKPTMASELMLGLCFARVPDFKFRIIEEDVEHCKVFMARPGSEYTGQYTIADAQAAGLLGKENWVKYRAAMLRARTISLTARVLAPDVTLGIYTPDEMGAVVTEDEEVVRMPASEVGDTQAVNGKLAPCCAECENEIKSGQYGGRRYLAVEVAEASEKKYGKPLCRECVVKRVEAAKHQADETAALRSAVAQGVSKLTPITKQSTFLRENPTAVDLPAATHDQLLGLLEGLKALDKRPI